MVSHLKKENERYGIKRGTEKWNFVRKTIHDSLPNPLPSTDSRNHKSNEDASKAIVGAKQLMEYSRINSKSKAKQKLSLKDITDILIETIAFTAVSGGSDGALTLAIYNYDKKIYEFNPQQLSEWIADTESVVTDKTIKDVMSTILANRKKLIPYWVRPKYLLPVKNGILDIFDRTLIDYSIEFTITSRVETDYYPFADHPDYEDGFTFESMLDTASSGKVERKELIMQFMSYCLLGYTYDPKIMNVIGDTGSGKSTLFGLITNIIGRNQIANITYAQVDNIDILLSAVGSWLIFGDDSRGKTFIKSSDFIKIKADNGYFSMSRKYLSAVTVKFDMPMIELMNAHPRIDEAGQQITSRLVWLEMNKSLTKQSKANLNIRESYIKDEAFHQYVLSYFIDKFNLFDHFNSVDNSHNESILASNDILGQFYSDLHAQGGIDSCKYLPTKLLYASYCEWARINNPSGKMFVNRGLTDNSASILSEYGYELNTNLLRVKTLEADGNIDPEKLKFAYVKDKQEVEQLMESGVQSRCFIRRANTVPAPLINLESKSIDFIEFFKLTPQFNEYMGYDLKKQNDSKNKPKVQSYSLRDVSAIFDFEPNIVSIENKVSNDTIDSNLNDDVIVDENKKSIKDEKIEKKEKENKVEPKNKDDSKENTKIELNFESPDPIKYPVSKKGTKQLIKDLNKFRENINSIKKNKKLEEFRLQKIGNVTDSFGKYLLSLFSKHKNDTYLRSFTGEMMSGNLDSQLNSMIECVEYVLSNLVDDDYDNDS